MPESAVRTFNDPDDYAASVRRSAVEMVVTGRGEFTAKLIRIDLHRLLMQRFSETLPRIWHCATEPERAYFTFRTHPGPRLLWGDAEAQPSSIRRHIEHDAVFGRSSGSARHAAMSLPVEEMALLSATIGGCDLMPPKDSLTVTPARRAMRRLQWLHAAAGELAENAPEIIANPEAARGLEHALIEALVACLASGRGHETSFAQRQHAIVMRRFRKVMEESPEEPLYIADICKAIRVSERTLRMCCEEHLGMAPKRYLLLRRMHLARRALRQSVPDATSVTETATRFGFWQLGRFAVAYQLLFGESPSATLHRQFE